MNPNPVGNDENPKPTDRLDSYGIYRLARQLFDDFWDDAEVLAKDFRVRELAKQQRGFGREWPQHLKIARGEARESLGRYERCRRLLPAALIKARVATLDHIIGGLTKTISTIEGRPTAQSHHPSPVTRHSK